MSLPSRLLKICLLISTVSTVTAFAKVTGPSGDVRSVNANDFFFHGTNSKQYNENWSYQFVFDNGTKAFVNFNRAKIPTKGLKTGVDLTFKNLAGRDAQVGREYPAERFVEDKANKTLSITSGQSKFFMKGLPKKGHQVHFETDKDGGFYLDVEFKTAVIGKVPGNAKWRLDGDDDADYYHWIHTPYATVEGTIGTGSQRIKVKGYAYMDHVMSSRMATETTNKAYLFSSPGGHIAGRIGQGSKDYGRGVFGYAMIYRNESFHVIQPTMVDIEDKLVRSAWDNLDEFSFQSSGHKGCYSPLDNIEGSMARWAAKKILGGKIILCPGVAKSSMGSINYLKFHVDD